MGWHGSPKIQNLVKCAVSCPRLYDSPNNVIFGMREWNLAFSLTPNLSLIREGSWVGLRELSDIPNSSNLLAMGKRTHRSRWKFARKSIGPTTGLLSHVKCPAHLWRGWCGKVGVNNIPNSVKCAVSGRAGTTPCTRDESILGIPIGPMGISWEWE